MRNYYDAWRPKIYLQIVGPRPTDKELITEYYARRQRELRQAMWVHLRTGILHDAHVEQSMYHRMQYKGVM